MTRSGADGTGNGQPSDDQRSSQEEGRSVTERSADIRVIRETPLFVPTPSYGSAASRVMAVAWMWAALAARRAWVAAEGPPGSMSPAERIART